MMGCLQKGMLKINTFCSHRSNVYQALRCIYSFAYLPRKKYFPVFHMCNKSLHTSHVVKTSHSQDWRVGKPKFVKQNRSQSYLETVVQVAAKNLETGIKINWEDVIKKATEVDTHITTANFGGILLVVCHKFNSFEVAKSFMESMKTPNLVQLASFMRICGDNMDKVTEEEVIVLYKKIQAKNHGIWDYHLADKVIFTLSKTSLWKETVNIMKAAQVGGEGSLKSRSDMVSAAFINNEFDLGWTLLYEGAHHGFQHSVFSDWLRQCPKTEDSFKKLIDFCDVFEVYPTEKLMTDISSYLHTSLNYNKGKTVKINPKTGECSNCKKALSRSALTTEEFKILQDTFLKHVLLCEDIFLNTTPQEMRDYIEYIRKNGPFDYVLDALNIAHARKTAENKYPDGRLLGSIVFKFASEGKRVLVIGREHMNRWPKWVLKQISEYGYLFLIDNKSEDDPFIIYAALKSGYNALYISKDFMRNHTYRLNDAKIARLFKRWRLTHQLSPNWNYRTNDLNLVPFSPLLPVPQKNADSGIWHIPYDTDAIYSPYELPSYWMCFTPKS